MWRPFREFAAQLRGRQHHREIWRTAERLSPADLRRGADDDDLSTADLFPAPERMSPRFLGYYTEAGIDYALRAYGIDVAARARGFDDLAVELTQHDRDTCSLRVQGLVGDARLLLAEARCREVPLPRPRWVPSATLADLEGHARAVRIEWMLLQNPLAEFTAARPALPGQEHPGLGLGREVMEILRVLGWRLSIAAFVISPHYLHNAVLYSRKFLFIEPEHQAEFLAILRAGHGRPLHDLALAVHHGFLRNTKPDRPLAWPAHPEISPLNRELIRLYRGPHYEQAVRAALAETRVYIDWPRFEAARHDLMACHPEGGP